MTAEIRNLAGAEPWGSRKQAEVREVFSRLFACLGIGIACALSAASGAAAVVVFPAALIPASALLWFKTGNKDIGTLQMIIGTYLCAIPINLIGNRSAQIALFGHHSAVSYSLIVLAVLGLGQLTDAVGSNSQQSAGPVLGFPLWAWGLAGGVVLLHMLFQSWVLHTCYGYGYEENGRALGWMSCFCLTWLLLRSALAATTWRRILCGLLLAYYAAMTVRII